MTSLTGIWAASLTPLKEDLSIDHARLVTHVRWLLDRGCHGVVLLGTTGEGNSFSVAERIEIMERAAESGLPLERLMVGTGSCALPDAVALSKRAVALGYRAVLMLPPFYYKRVQDDGIYDFVHRVVHGVNENGLRIVLYHFPAMAGIGYSLELISRLRTFYPDQIVGVKDSGGDESHLADLCTEFPGFGVFAGTERLMPQALRAGGVGCVSATANVTSTLVRSVYDQIVAQAEGEPRGEAKARPLTDAVAEAVPRAEAKARPVTDTVAHAEGVAQAEAKARPVTNTTGLHIPEIDQMLAFRAALEAGPLVRVLKYVMATRADTPSWNTLRPPLTSFGPSEAESLENTLIALPEFPNFVL